MSEFVDDELRNQARQDFAQILSDLSKRCTLIYSATDLECPNCVINTQTKVSTGRYKPGGPQPFINGTICPICNGTGRLASTGGQETIPMRISYKQESWVNFIPDDKDNKDLRIPGGIVKTRGRISDISKVLRCDSAVLDIDANFTGNTYVLYRIPLVVGTLIQLREFECYWRRSVIYEG